MNIRTLLNLIIKNIQFKEFEKFTYFLLCVSSMLKLKKQKASIEHPRIQLMKWEGKYMFLLPPLWYIQCLAGFVKQFALSPSLHLRLFVSVFVFISKTIQFIQTKKETKTETRRRKVQRQPSKGARLRAWGKVASQITFGAL